MADWLVWYEKTKKKKFLFAVDKTNRQVKTLKNKLENLSVVRDKSKKNKNKIRKVNLNKIRDKKQKKKNLNRQK